MKVLSHLVAITLAFAHLSAARESDSNGPQNATTTALSNGALLRAEILLPQTNDTFILPNITSNYTQVSLVGSASVERGVPDVTYIYVIDNSGSTGFGNDDCGNVLECMQKFVFAFHTESIRDGSASMVAVINFDDDVYVSADLQDVTENATAVKEAIFSGYPEGENYCQDALNKAAELVRDPRNKAKTSVVVFVGDGECSTCGKGCPIDRDYELVHTNAVVHSVAVGRSVDCVDSLNDIPANGGTCTSVPDPDHLPHYIDQLVGSDLFKVEMRVNNGTYQEIPESKLFGSELPAEAPAKTNFNVTFELPVGTHEVCVRATGDDSLGANDTVTKCKSFFVEAPPVTGSDSACSKAAIAAAIVVTLLAVPLMVVLVWKLGCKSRETKEDVKDPTDYDLEGSERSGEVC